MKAVALCGMLCLALDPLHAQDPAVLRSEFLGGDPPTPEVHASTLVETGGGLVAAWFGGVRERHPSVGIWLSRQEDGRWTAPVEVADGVQADGTRLPTWNPVLFQPRRGPLLLFYKVGPSPERWWGMVKSSEDGGRSWSAARRLPDGVIGPVKNKPVELADGTILSGSSTEHDGWRVHFERSTDGGRSWEVIGPIHDGRTIGAIQPSILRHPDGRLQAVGRSRQDRVFTVESRDGGRSWGPVGLLHLPNPNAGTDAVTLADGRHLLVYNHARSTPGSWSAGRGVLNVALSRDGQRWEAALVLEDEPGAEFSYPAVIQTSDGRVHITYTWKRRRIRYLVIDPSRLALRPIVDETWPR